jgi:S-formylglutathione hydrolase FrmB
MRRQTVALIHCDFFSHTLQLCTSMCVILPQPAPQPNGSVRPAPGTRYPTLYLLHGLSDDHTIWQRRTSIERYVEGLELAEGCSLAVVMPAVGRSFYTDMAKGHRYWTFISEELPEITRSFFPLSGAREDNFVAGLSMGGYGAFKLALSHPDRYAAAASLSGALDIAAAAEVSVDGLRSEDEAWLAELSLIFGDLKRIAGSENDLFYLAQRAVASGEPLPRLYQWCGIEDFLYPANVRFRQHAQQLGLDLTYEEASGDHQWEYWDRQIRRVLAWLPLPAGRRVMNVNKLPD